MAVVDFISSFGNLKRTVRTGWLNRGVSKGAVESVADHVSRTILIALVLADTLPSGVKLRKDRLLTMALLHDLAEVYLKDVDREAWKYMTAASAGKAKVETAAVKDLLAKLPQRLRSDYFDLWETYRRGVTLEARVVHAADKLELAFQAQEYVRHGMPASMVEEMMREAGRELSVLKLENAITLFRKVERKIADSGKR